MGAITTYSNVSKSWSQDHYERRMVRSVQQAIAAGTGYMRSHIDCFGKLEGSASWAAALAIKEAFKEVIEIQLSPLTSMLRCDDANFPVFCREIAQQGTVVGAFVAPGATDQSIFERFLNHAAACDLDVDFHIDENLTDPLPAIECLADAVIATGFRGRVTAGHVCALLNARGADFERVLDKVSDAGIAIVTLPRTNLYLQDRTAGATPRRRGITAIHEMHALGIPVSFGTDNVGDTFFPFGDYDLLGVFRDTVVAAHLDQDLNSWIPAITHLPATAIGVKDAGVIARGKRADAVLIPAANWPDLLNSKSADRIVLCGGQPLDMAARAVQNKMEAKSCQPIA
jgi:cytosine deaminase